MATIEEIYQEIGQEIANKIPEKWDLAEVVFIYHHGMSVIESSYKLVDSVEKKRNIAGRRLMELFIELHDKLIEAGQADWKQAVYVLRPDGKFDLWFEY